MEVTLEKCLKSPPIFKSASQGIHSTMAQKCAFLSPRNIELMKFNPRPGIDVFVGDSSSEKPEEWIVIRLEDLEAMYEFVSKEVIPRFERFFSK